MQPIPNLDGYFATEDGEVVSMRSGIAKVLATQNNGGYLRVTVSVRVAGVKERHRFEVHRLVLKAYAGTPADHALQARHLDGNSLNNKPSNLAWGTTADNAADAVRHGTLGPGMRSRRRRLTDVQVMEIRRRSRAGASKHHLAQEFGVHPEYIPKIVSGEAWSCLPL